MRPAPVCQRAVGWTAEREQMVSSSALLKISQLSRNDVDVSDLYRVLFED